VGRNVHDSAVVAVVVVAVDVVVGVVVIMPVDCSTRRLGFAAGPVSEVNFSNGEKNGRGVGSARASPNRPYALCGRPGW
jgi:hypothetical protein